MPATGELLEGDTVDELAALDDREIDLLEFLDNTFGFALPDSIATSPEEGGVFNLPAVAIVAAVTFVLIRGVRETARANFIMVVIKLLVLAFFIVVAFSAAFNTDNLEPFAVDGADGVVSAAAIIFFAYIGFDAVSTGAEEARNPSRDLPLAIVGSLVVCTIIYILVSIAAVGSLDAAALQESDAPLAAALTRAPRLRLARLRTGAPRAARRRVQPPHPPGGLPGGGGAALRRVAKPGSVDPG